PDSGVEVARDIHFLKGYTVFNVEQIEGLPAQYTAPASPRLDVSARIARAERFFGATGATLIHGGNRAFYRPSTDSIVLPLFETFRDAESYYAIFYERFDRTRRLRTFFAAAGERLRESATKDYKGNLEEIIGNEFLAMKFDILVFSALKHSAAVDYDDFVNVAEWRATQAEEKLNKPLIKAE